MVFEAVAGDHVQLVVDHIVPSGMGGSDSFHNLQLLCVSCNAKKGAQIIPCGMPIAEFVLALRREAERLYSMAARLDTEAERLTSGDS